METRHLTRGNAVRVTLRVATRITLMMSRWDVLSRQETWPATSGRDFTCLRRPAGRLMSAALRLSVRWWGR